MIPKPDRESVTAAVARLLTDSELRERLGEAGRRTAADYAWDLRIDALESFLERIATPVHAVAADGATREEPSAARESPRAG